MANPFSTFIVKILEKLLIPAKGEPLKVYFKGIGIAILGCGLLFFLCFYSDVKKYRSFGQKLGTFKVKKDNKTEVAAEELTLIFNEHVYSGDSILLFPYFEYASWSSVLASSCISCEIGRRMLISSKCCDYTIDFAKLDTNGKDTIAYFDVYRKYKEKP